MIFERFLKPKKKKKIEIKRSKTKKIKNKIIGDIKKLFEWQEEEHYEPKRVSDVCDNNYIEYENNDEKK